MSKPLIELLAWTNTVNAKSPAKLKKLQKEVMGVLAVGLLENTSSGGQPPMTISEPVVLSVDTVTGPKSRRHFIGGEEIRLVKVEITPRTYKPVLHFIPMYATDVKTIFIPLTNALEFVSGLEIRMMAAGDLLTMLERAYELNSETVVKQVDRSGSQYDAIGYGSW